MTEKSVPSKEELAQILEESVVGLVKEKIEEVMKMERKAFLEEEDSDNIGNGYHTRDLGTRYGKIEDLMVPRDREGNFNTKLFEPYQRRSDWLEELIIKLYTKGMSTRKIANLIEEMYGDHYSAATVSRITDLALEEVEEWQNRPLKRRYSVIYLDGMTISLKRDTVEKEVVYFAAGIDEEGYREILGFYVGGRESSTVWEEILKDLKERGVKEVLIVVTDDLSGIDEVIVKAFPKADHQQCMLHKVRNTVNKVRKIDVREVTRDLKKVYQSPVKEMAQECFEDFASKWGKKYPKVVDSWRGDLPNLLTFMDYPYEIRGSIYTNNWLEREIKEMRRRVKVMESLPSPKAADKLFYLLSSERNNKWNRRRMKGFKAACADLQEMFVERYENKVEKENTLAPVLETQFS